METTRLNNEEIIELIQYGIADNEVQIEKTLNIQSILYDYNGLCYEEEKRRNGELDTFTQAACLLVAINTSNLTSDRIMKASVAISAATKMCENAYIEDTRYNTLIVLQEMDIKQAYENDPGLYNYWTKTMFEGLIQQNESIEQYTKDLKTFHEVTARVCENKRNEKTKSKDRQATITYIK